MADKYIKEMDELKLVGFRVLCPGDQYIKEIPKATWNLEERVSEIKHVIHPIRQIGAFVVDNETDEEDGYWVCVEVKEFEDVPADMVTLVIPAQRYAAFRYNGPNHKIMHEAYGELHKWMEKKNLKRLENKWHLEVFFSWKDIENVDIELLDTVE
ncbi:GyrI-like domain-containing protein [Radiobacillus kanasensis]|uniref:GyrI-like domain-containing protein n=1 Tax=Radiobacillus kanasensis TaxID=2844358 RepID=UPI002EDB98EB